MSLFKRRIILSRGEKVREMLWPRQGIGRTVRYWRHRLVRLPGTPRSIAAGVASGISMSFTPPGLHMLFAAGLAVLTRGNVFAATLVSVVFGNPLMTALLLSMDIGVGELLVGGRRQTIGGDVSLIEFFQHPFESLQRFGVPFIIGALVLAVLSWLLTYFFALRFIDFAHARRAKRLRRDWQKKHEVFV